MGGQFDQKPLAEAIMGRGQEKNFHDRLAVIRSLLIGSVLSNHTARRSMHAEGALGALRRAWQHLFKGVGRRETVAFLTVCDRLLDLVVSHAARRASSETRTSRTRKRATHEQLAAAVEGRGS